MITGATYRWAIAACLSAGLCFAVSFLLLRGNPPLPRAQATFTPFTLHFEVTSFVHDPKGELHRRQTVAVRSDGSRSTTSTILGKLGVEAGETARTVQFMNGRKVTIYPSIQARTTWQPLDPPALQQIKQRLFNPPESCASPAETLTRSDNLENQPVAVVTHISEPLGFKVVDWRAPALGCQSLRYTTYERQPDGSFSVRTEGKTVTMELGEPDPALFEEPAGYREMKPSETEQALARKYHIALTTDLLRLEDIMDKAYLGTLRKEDLRRDSPAPEAH